MNISHIAAAMAMVAGDTSALPAYAAPYAARTKPRPSHKQTYPAPRHLKRLRGCDRNKPCPCGCGEKSKNCTKSVK